MSIRLHCIRGCTRRGQHLADCEDRDTCKGCEPRPAAIGQLCIGCHGRLTQDIGRIPDLITHIREHVQPGAVRRDSMVQGTRTPPAPLALDAVDAADRLYAVLRSWTEMATDELELSPLAGGGWTLPGRTDAVGLRSGARGDDSAKLATRLLTHLDRACAYEWVGEMATEMREAVRPTLLRWPTEERPTYLPTPCPRCDMLSLVRHAPETFEGRVTIACRRGECGEVVAEDKYGLLTRMVLDDHARAQEVATEEVPA
jgi:hypothetical protein